MIGLNALESGRSHKARFPESTPIVYVIEDDVSVREALESMFVTAGIRSKAFESAESFLSYPRETCAACIILDVCLPVLNGIDLQRLLSADDMAIPVIFITAYSDVPTSVSAMKAGAVEFLIKPVDDRVLLGAVEHAIDNCRGLLARKMEIEDLRERYAALTCREKEVMALVVSGLLNKQIGGELGISEITVKAHRGSMTRKMRALSVPDLVAMSYKLGIEVTSRRR